MALWTMQKHWDTRRQDVKATMQKSKMVLNNLCTRSEGNDGSRFWDGSYPAFLARFANRQRDAVAVQELLLLFCTGILED